MFVWRDTRATIAGNKRRGSNNEGKKRGKRAHSHGETDPQDSLLRALRSGRLGELDSRTLIALFRGAGPIQDDNSPDQLDQVGLDRLSQIAGDRPPFTRERLAQLDLDQLVVAERCGHRGAETIGHTTTTDVDEWLEAMSQRSQVRALLGAHGGCAIARYGGVLGLGHRQTSLPSTTARTSSLRATTLRIKNGRRAFCALLARPPLQPQQELAVAGPPRGVRIAMRLGGEP